MSKVPFSKLDVATLRCSFGALPARRGDSGDREGYNRDVGHPVLLPFLVTNIAVSASRASTALKMNL
jgi:hypothetical protein